MVMIIINTDIINQHIVQYLIQMEVCAVNLFKEKLVLLSPAIVLVVALIFCLTMVPSINPAPKNLPIAIVNEDQGVQLPNQQNLNIGKELLRNIKKASSANEGEAAKVKWIEVNSEDKVIAGFNGRDYYGAIIIPKDFSKKQASLQTTNPSVPEMKIYVNQGMNATASNMASQMLTQITANINSTVSKQLLANLEKQGGSITLQQAPLLAAPVSVETIIVNKTGTNSANGNAPVLMFQPIWMSSLLGAVLLFLANKKMRFQTKKEKLTGKALQILFGALLALIVGFGTASFASGLGLNIPDISETALFLAVASFSFYLMISAVFAWIGFAGMPIFILALFFGLPLLSMAPEFMSTFYHDWIYAWLPFRFLVDGLRELFYFGGHLSLNEPTIVLLSIGCVSLVVFLASVLKLAQKTELHSETI